MAGMKSNVNNLWNVSEYDFLEELELDDSDDIEYIVEYIDSNDGQDQPDSAAADLEEGFITTTTLRSIRPANGDVENSVWSSKYPDYPEMSAGAGRKIAQSKSGPLGLAKAAKTPSECLSLFLDADVIATIAEHTNARIAIEKRNYARQRDANQTDEMEILSLLGVLYIASAVRDGRQNINYLFETKKGTGMEAVFLTMSIHRFLFLVRCLQFDDPVTMADEMDSDKLAPIRAVYERIVGSFQKYFRPGRHLTMDEQLVPFKGRCDFRQFIAHSPGNSGFKFNLLVDCVVPYTCNLEIIVPNNHNPYNMSYEPSDVVMRMTEPIQGKHKTVILGPKFTSLEIIKKLHDSRTTVIGEVKKSHKDIPRLFAVSKGRTERDTLTAYHEMATLISHMVRSKDLLILMSSHRDESSETVDVENPVEGARDPKIVQIYNQSKTAVQQIQQMCSMYDVMRSSRRWQLIVFFNLMNLSAINAWCIYRLNQSESDLGRRDFLIEMALEFMRPQARRRMDIKTIPRALKQRIGMFLGLEREEYDVVPALSNRRGSRGRCYLCGRARNKTTRITCDACGKFTCNAHCAYLCHTCYTDDGTEH